MITSILRCRVNRLTRRRRTSRPNFTRTVHGNRKVTRRGGQKSRARRDWFLPVTKRYNVLYYFLRRPEARVRKRKEVYVWNQRPRRRCHDFHRLRCVLWTRCRNRRTDKTIVDRPRRNDWPSFVYYRSCTRVSLGLDSSDLIVCIRAHSDFTTYDLKHE